MKRRRGDNLGNVKTETHTVKGTDELDAFDQLGPLAKQALREAPVKWLAIAIVHQIRQAEESMRARLPEHMRATFSLDLQDYRLDRNIANGIRDQSLSVILVDRPMQDARLGVTPLVPNYTALSRREQRRTAGRTRW